MLRMFQTNYVRKSYELDGIWSFRIADEDGREHGQQFGLPVPGCWEMHPELQTYRGKGVYRRTVTVRELTHLRFIFKGVSHTADVYFNGEHVANHYNAYTAFEALVQDVAPGTHELKIVVDNGFHEGSSLHVHNDYYTYGGLIRPVAVEELGDTYIERIIFTPEYANEQWSARIQTIVRNISETDEIVLLQGELAGQAIDFGEVNVEAGGVATVQEIIHMKPAIIPWSAQNPKLYALELKLLTPNSSKIIDDLIDRVGFRTVTTKNGKIQVNGEDIILKGFNRHEDHALVGAAFPVSLMVQDLDLMIDMGCNSVRTSHYPNDERFLDLCDELGLYVWEENHARGLNLEQMRNPNFIRQCKEGNREMVEQHYNHPSIIIWAILNECASWSEEGKVHYKRQLDQIRSLDISRPLTFASCHREKELCFDLADIVSFNLYPGWYKDEDPGELCDLARSWADAAGGLGKPMIMSEFGADAVYGYRSTTRVKGTEERQADIIDSNLEAYLKRDYVSGMYIWQFCDCRVTEEKVGPLWRVTTQNLKGVVDTYRRPKLAYEVVKKHFRV